MKKSKKSKKWKINPAIFGPPPTPTPNDMYAVDGVKYIREDLVNQKMDATMERIAKALETQVEFLKKWDKPMGEMSKMMSGLGKKTPPYPV